MLGDTDTYDLRFRFDDAEGRCQKKAGRAQEEGASLFQRGAGTFACGLAIFQWGAGTCHLSPESLGGGREPFSTKGKLREASFNPLSLWGSPEYSRSTAAT